MAKNSEITRNIRVIAETDKIKKDVDKALKSIEDIEKDQIDLKKVIAFQKGDGTKGVDTGGSGNETGTDANGDTTQFPTAPPQNPPNNNTNTNTNTDAGANIGNASGDLFIQGTGTSQTDLSNSATSPSAGGSLAKNQAEDGENDSELQSIIDEMVANGVPQTVIDKFVEDYLKTTAGTQNVGKVMDGKAGPPPSYTGFGGDLPWRPSTALGAVVGLYPDDITKSIVVNFKEKSYLPSIADALAAGQNPWTDFNQGPILVSWNEWEQGFYWTCSSPASSEAAAPRVAIEESLSSIAATFPDPYPVGFGDVFWDEVLTPVGDDYQFTWYQGPGAPANNVLVVRNDCDIGHASVCPTEAQREINWPAVGTFILNLVDGKFVGSVFDSEIPPKYQNLASSVQLQTNDGRIINVLPAINGGILLQDQSGTETALYYDHEGKLRAFVNPSELNFYLPRF